MRANCRAKDFMEQKGVHLTFVLMMKKALASE